MGPTLEALLELQDIELQIVDIRRQLERKRRLVRRQEQKLHEAKDKLVVEQEVLRRQQVNLDELDVDLKGRTAQINRFREHLNSVRTNKEYAAVLAQLNNEKADVNRIESKAMEMMQGVESQKQVVAECRTAEEAEASRLGDLKAQSGQAEATFSEKLGQLTEQRKQAAVRVDPQVMVLFDRLSERYDGEVMAKIERTHPRRDEFSCGGCHMTLSAEAYNATSVRDEPQTCGNCGRILFVEK